jgi:hypothetical protein
MRKKEDIFWGSGDEETLAHTEMHDALEQILDGLVSPLPRKVSVSKYRRETPAQHIDLGTVIEGIIESLDERYGDIDGEPTQITEKMKLAGHKFIETIRSEYVPWTCEICETVEVDVKQWIEENAPEWLEYVEFKDNVIDNA